MKAEAAAAVTGATMPESENRVFTIGHSTLAIQAFLNLLKMARITAVADVRSSPFSRRIPHFSREKLKVTLKENGIKYVFLGKELGGRPRTHNLYCNRIADYEKMALQPEFSKGIDRVISGSEEHTVALMCSEHNPLDCHWCLLVGRVLAERHVPLSHILNNGRIADQREIEDKLLGAAESATDDMFSSREERLAKAYRLRAKNVAYREASSGMIEYATMDRYNYVP